MRAETIARQYHEEPPPEVTATLRELAVGRCWCCEWREAAERLLGLRGGDRAQAARIHVPTARPGAQS